MTESSLLARTLWSLRSVEAVVSLLSASEIFLLLSSWSERSLEYLRNCFNLSPPNKQQHWFGKESRLKAWEDSQIYSPKVILKAVLKAWLGVLVFPAELWMNYPASSPGFGSQDRARTRQGRTPRLLVSMRHLWQALPNPNLHRASEITGSHGVFQRL